MIHVAISKPRWINHIQRVVPRINIRLQYSTHPFATYSCVCTISGSNSPGTPFAVPRSACASGSREIHRPTTGLYIAAPSCVCTVWIMETVGCEMVLVENRCCSPACLPRHDPGCNGSIGTIRRELHLLRSGWLRVLRRRAVKPSV